jgi:hypothetical protein
MATKTAVAQSAHLSRRSIRIINQSAHAPIAMPTIPRHISTKAMPKL